MEKRSTVSQWFDELELRIIGWMEKSGMLALRIALGIVFIWFGVLKPFGLSPADKLVRDVTYWSPIPHFVFVLGIWEIAIGLCFLYKPLLRLGLLLLFLHMPGTALPFLLLPERCWQVFPYALTLEGQYIVKNLVLVAAALVIGGKIRHRMKGFIPFASDEFMTLLNYGSWCHADAGEVLVERGEDPEYLYFIYGGRAEVQVDGEVVATLVPNQFVGEMSFLTKEPASATVIASEPLRLIRWSRTKLSTLLSEQPKLLLALQATISLDLLAKLRSNESHETATDDLERGQADLKGLNPLH